MKKWALVFALVFLAPLASFGVEQECLGSATLLPGSARTQMLTNTHSVSGPGDYLLVVGTVEITNSNPNDHQVIFELEEASSAVATSTQTLNVPAMSTISWQITQEVYNLVAGSYEWQIYATNGSSPTVTFQTNTCIDILEREVRISCGATGGGGGAGITSLNGLTDIVQTFSITNNAAAVAFTSSAGNHALNIPDASFAERGLVNTGGQVFAGSKAFASAVDFNAQVSFGITNHIVTGSSYSISPSTVPSNTVLHDLASSARIDLSSTPTIFDGGPGDLLILRNIGGFGISFQDNDTISSNVDTIDNLPIYLDPGQSVILSMGSSTWKQVTPTETDRPLINYRLQTLAVPGIPISWQAVVNFQQEAGAVDISNASGGPLTITAAPSIFTGAKAGQVIFIHNQRLSPFSVTLQDESSLSNSDLRFLGGTNKTLAAGQSVLMVYDGAEWYEAGSSGTGGASTFTQITTGANTTANMDCGTGCDLEPINSGRIEANDTSCTTTQVLLGGGAGCTPFSGIGIQSLNLLTGGTQTFAVGTAGTAPAISSAGTVHTFNFPDAGTGITQGLVNNGAQSIAGAKVWLDNLWAQKQFQFSSASQNITLASDQVDTNNTSLIVLTNSTGGAIVLTSTTQIGTATSGRVLLIQNSRDSNASIAFRDQNLVANSNVETYLNENLVLEPSEGAVFVAIANDWYAWTPDHLPAAGAGVPRGVITDTVQTIGGSKSFNNDVNFLANANFALVEDVVIDAVGDSIAHANSDFVEIQNTTGGSITLTSAPSVGLPDRDGQLLVIFNSEASDSAVILQDANVLASSGVQSYNDQPIAINPGKGVLFISIDLVWQQVTPGAAVGRIIDDNDLPVGEGLDTIQCGSSLTCVEGTTDNIVTVDVAAGYKSQYTSYELADMGALGLNGATGGADQDIDQSPDIVNGNTLFIGGKDARRLVRYSWECQGYDPNTGIKYCRAGQGEPASSGANSIMRIGPCQQLAAVEINTFDWVDAVAPTSPGLTGDKHAGMGTGQNISVAFRVGAGDGSEQCTLNGGAASNSKRCNTGLTASWTDDQEVSLKLNCATGCATDLLTVYVHALCY